MSREIQSCPNHKQRLALEALGFNIEGTDDTARAHWSGHGLRFELPATMELDHATAMQCVIHAARDAGKRDHQHDVNAWLELATGRKQR